MNHKKIFLKLSFLAILFSVSFLFKDLVLAADPYTCSCINGNQLGVASCGICDSECQKLNSRESGCVASSIDQAGGAGKNNTTSQKLPNPLGITDVNALIARVINFVLSLVGSVSLLMFVYGGLTWMTSAGSSEKIKKGRDIIVWSVIGLAIVFSSYILVKFVVTSLVG